MVKKCVHRAVRTKYLNIIQTDFRLKIVISAIKLYKTKVKEGISSKGPERSSDPPCQNMDTNVYRSYRIDTLP